MIIATTTTREEMNALTFRTSEREVVVKWKAETQEFGLCASTLIRNSGICDAAESSQN